VPSEKITPEHVNLMARFARSTVTITMTAERLDELNIPAIAPTSLVEEIEPFSVSVDLRQNGSSGMSAKERAATIRALVDPASKPEDFVRPGHVFPLRYDKGGVFTRPRASEAMVDLTRMAGLYASAVLCAVMDDSGDMMSAPMDITVFARSIGLKLVSVSDVMQLRGTREKVVQRVASAKLPTRYGEFALMGYQCMRDTDEHVALVMGDTSKNTPIPTAFISGCVVGHAFDNASCGCGDRLHKRMERIAKAGRGVVIYTPVATICKHLADGSMAPLPKQDRMWEEIVGLQVLADLGIRKALVLDDKEHVEEVPRITAV
jgi:3,4-dihydroxy 2-butanone 4-phosphate synthase/GTP cyclohydrolase II